MELWDGGRKIATFEVVAKARQRELTPISATIRTRPPR